MQCWVILREDDCLLLYTLFYTIIYFVSTFFLSFPHAVLCTAKDGSQLIFIQLLDYNDNVNDLFSYASLTQLNNPLSSIPSFSRFSRFKNLSVPTLMSISSYLGLRMYWIFFVLLLLSLPLLLLFLFLLLLHLSPHFHPHFLILSNTIHHTNTAIYCQIQSSRRSMFWKCKNSCFGLVGPERRNLHVDASVVPTLTQVNECSLWIKFYLFCFILYYIILMIMVDDCYFFLRKSRTPYPSTDI